MSPPLRQGSGGQAVDRLIADAKAQFADPDQAIRWVAEIAVSAARGASAGYMRAKPAAPVRAPKPPPKALD